VEPVEIAERDDRITQGCGRALAGIEAGHPAFPSVTNE